MTPLLNSSSKRGALGVAAAAAALSIAAPVAGASSDIDPAIYDSGVPATTVEHGVESVTITGSARPSSDKVEYWVSGNRFREQTTDAKTGKLIAARVHDASGTTYYSVKGPSGRPFVEHAKGPDSIPGPGWPAAYNKKLLAGTRQSNASHQWTLTLKPIGPVTLAGVTGTKYELLVNGAPEANSHNEHTYLSLDADAKPLARETTADNGSHGQFDQTETLVSRESVPAGAAGGAVAAQVSKASFQRSVKEWRAKAAKAKRTSKKHHR
jgi:hypothetical protein